MQIKIYHRRKMLIMAAFIVGIGLLLTGRLVYLMIFRSEYYQEQASALHERERSIKAARGVIYDRNGIVLADNQSVCTISVIHNQITDPEKVISVLSDVLSLDETSVRKRVEKVSSIERIKANVSKELGDKIRSYQLKGVMGTKTIRGIIRMERWHPRYWALQAEIIRGLSGWKLSMTSGLKELKVPF